MKSRKIWGICGHGGHLNEMTRLLPAFSNHDFFLTTFESDFTRKIAINEGIRTVMLPLPTSEQCLPNKIGYLRRMLRTAIWEFSIFIKEKPDIIISTGSEIASPAILFGFIFHRNRIYVESLCRVYELSTSGKILLPFVNLFLVQWEELSDKYPSRVQYWGRVI